MTHRTIEGKNLDVGALLAANNPPNTLAIHTIQKAHLGKLVGLDKLQIVELELRWLSTPDLTDIPLPPTLRSLRIWHSNKLHSLAGIEKASQITHLDLRETGALNIEPLQHLQALRSLSIRGGYGKGQKIDSLAPIQELPIETITLQAIDGAALDLTPLTRLSRITSLDLAGQCFDPTELAKVAAIYPWYRAQLLDLPVHGLSGMGCKKCKSQRKELFLKGKKFLWCPDCEAKGLQAALDGFEMLIAAARQP